jgi:DNA-binding NarL/FixJ family response regulator
MRVLNVEDHGLIASALRALRQLQPAARVVIFSGEADPHVACHAAACGAFAFIPKSLDEDDLNAALSEVLNGVPVFPADAQQPRSHAGSAEPVLCLTLRAMLKGVLLGLANMEIAQKACLSLKQVKCAMEDLLALLDVPHRRGLAEYVRRQADRPTIVRALVQWEACVTLPPFPRGARAVADRQRRSHDLSAP